MIADVAVVGSGIAGNFAAIEAARAGARVLVLTKDVRLEGNTRWAQGGIAAVLESGDTAERHAADTISAGDGLCRGDVVRSIVGAGPDAIAALEEAGARFDRDDRTGELVLAREGGHQCRRIAHADGDGTGLHIQRALCAAVAAVPGIRVTEKAFVVDVLTGPGGETAGLLVRVGDELRVVWSRAVVLASGGAARLFRESTNPSVTTGDGIAMAWRAGAAVRDMEFMQFHPTVLYVPGAPRTLLSEAARGEGAVVTDQRGRRFLSDFDPRGELAPRDVVSRAIVEHMDRHGDDHVLLDLSPIAPERLRARLPGVVETGRAVGIDVEREPLPIRPAAHYTVGGVLTDVEGRTTVPGLFAAGEVASNGLHGANRLASNSLLEGVVVGRAAGRAAASHAKSAGAVRPLDLRDDGPGPDAKLLDVADLVRSVASLVWRRAGVRRNGRDLAEARDDLRRWARRALGVSLRRPRGFEAQNLAVLAQLLVEGAALREETRGVHWRGDFPSRDDTRFRAHFVQRRGAEPQAEPWSDRAEEIRW
ncbi:MAG: L-aspartate oxidase [Planctomycetes bacterium]|nr:L-aspartate oxidase [Planctomycetota bacterium]